MRVNHPLVDSAKANLVCAFSMRVSGNMSLCYGDTGNSLANRKDFLDTLAIDYRDLVCAKQIHSSSIAYVSEEEDKGKGALFYDTAIPATDSLMTDRKNLPLAVFTADCLSIFLYDALVPCIGLIHAGWRSTKEAIAKKTAEFIKDKFNTDISRLYVSFGPAIKSCCYAVDKSFADFFPQDLQERDNQYYLDLAAVNIRQLLESGVREENIFDPGICTSCRNQEFFSFRREGESCGRIMSIAMLK